MFCAKAGKFFTKARKFPAKFDVFRWRLDVLEPMFDVNSFLQVKPDGIHNFFAFGLTCKTVITSRFSTN